MTIDNAVRKSIEQTDKILNQLKGRDIIKFGWYLLGRAVRILSTCGLTDDEIIAEFRRLRENKPTVQ